MKKLTVLLMVTAMASSAGAGLSITVGSEGWGEDVGTEYVMNIGDTIWLGIYAEDMPDIGQFMAYLWIADDPESQSSSDWTGDNNVYIPPAIPQAYNSYQGYYTGYGDMWYHSNIYPDPFTLGSDGLHADFEFHCTAVGDVSIELVANDFVTVLDTLTIYQICDQPIIAFDPCEVSFFCREGGPNPAPQTLSIWNTNVSIMPLYWTVSDNRDWLAADPSSGTCDEQDIDQVTLSVDASGLQAGVYNCELTISDPCAWNNPQTVPVELQVFAPGDFDMDDDEDGDDLHTLALAWLSSSGGGNWNPDCDISDPNDEVIDGKDFGVFAMYWDGPAEAGMDYQIEACDHGAKAAGQDKNGLRFTVTVEGDYICFEDMMVANCCSDEQVLEMTVEGNLITLYEIEYTTTFCACICDYPVTATLGPFEAGTYTLEVYEGWGGFIGSTVVVIE